MRRAERDVPTRIARSRRWNRWDPAALELRARIEERTGAFEAAADDYARASELSQRPWLDHFREARAARGQGKLRLAAELMAEHQGLEEFLTELRELSPQDLDQVITTWLARYSTPWACARL